MMRWGVAWMVSLLVMGGGLSWAQEWNTLQSTATPGNGAELDVNGYHSVSLVINMASTGTVQIKIKGDGNYGDLACTDLSDPAGALVTSVTASKNLVCSTGGLSKVQTPITAAGGTITVKARVSNVIVRRGGGGGGGSGDVTDVWGCTSGNCNAITGAAGDSLDAGSADSSKPSTRSTSLPGTCTEGQLHQDTDSGGSETYVCTASNTWTKLAVDGSAGSSISPAAVTVNAGNSPYTVVSTDYLILCDTTAAARVINLHAATTSHVIAVSNLGANTCTINRAGADTIVGDVVVILAAQHDGITMISDGSSKWTMH